MRLSGNQLKAARALAGIDQVTLALTAGVTPQTLGRIEASGPNPVSGRAATLAALMDALNSAGVEIVPGGVRISDAPQRPQR